VSSRSALRVLAGGIGIVAVTVFGAAVAAAVFVALGRPSESHAGGRAGQAQAEEPAPAPAELVVALGLGDPVLQSGAVRGDQVVLARGFEVDVAREIARRLGIARVRFTYVRPASRLVAARVRPWHLTIAQVRPGSSAASVADLSVPYLSTDQAVVLRRGLAPVSSLVDLRRRITCAVRGSAGAAAIASVVRPAVQPILTTTPERLLQLVQTGACDAAAVDAAGVGRFVDGRGALLGPVRARIPSGSGYVVSVTRGSPVAVADVDRAVAAMKADGTLHRLARSWLGIDPARLRLLG
jgi:ABC-type amino acid transport substrate-binding protein